MGDRVTRWQIRGTYFESCNCDAICPCRRIDGRPGGRSTHGTCEGVLSWLIEDGIADGVDVSGLPVAMALRYSDDEEGSPWSWVLYVDERATTAQHDALVSVYGGALGGDAVVQFPWAYKPSNQLAVRRAAFEVDHRERRQRLRVRDLVRVSIRGAYGGPEQVTCIIPGHERSGEELIANEIVVADDLLQFSHRGVCGYQSTFDYEG
jgi:hypothetical protein